MIHNTVYRALVAALIAPNVAAPLAAQEPGEDRPPYPYTVEQIGTPAELGQRMVSDRDRLAQLIAEIGVKND